MASTVGIFTFLNINSSSAQAAQNKLCDTRAKIVASISKGYNEKQLIIALTNEGTMFEVFTSLETGSWSVLITNPDKTACLVAAGTSLETTIKPEKDGFSISLPEKIKNIK